MNIAAVILTKNEQDNIIKCLKSVSFATQILVIDDASVDQTLNLAKKFGAKTYKRALNDNFSGQRNFAMSKTKCEWLLFVDADEVVTEELSSEIVQSIVSSDYSAFEIKRENYWQGRKITGGEMENQYLVRLIKNNSGKWSRRVHEKWTTDKKVGRLKQKILHYPHPTLFSLIEHLGFYSKIHAQENRKENKQFAFVKSIFFPILKFINGFIIQQGYRDGVHGFVICVAMSAHSFMSWTLQWTDRDFGPNYK